jgi:hypothetical protein
MLSQIPGITVDNFEECIDQLALKVVVDEEGSA